MKGCGDGVALVDSNGHWLALDNPPDPVGVQAITTAVWSSFWALLRGCLRLQGHTPLLAGIKLVNASAVDCNDRVSPGIWMANTTMISSTDEGVMFTSAAPSAKPGANWYLTVDSFGFGEEGLIAVSATAAQIGGGLDAKALWFHMRLLQFCQPF